MLLAIRSAYFYSHAPCGARQECRNWIQVCSTFLLTRPMRGATGKFLTLQAFKKFLLTRPMRGATNYGANKTTEFTISTHTPLARRDSINALRLAFATHFYSHASCEARQFIMLIDIKRMHFYSHASCEARHYLFPTLHTC